MAVAVMGTNVVGVSPVQCFVKEGGVRSRTALAPLVCGRQMGWSGSESPLFGERFASCFSPRDSPRDFSMGNSPLGARAYTATEENTRVGYGSGAGTNNLYDLLGVSTTATPREIKAAYRLAARRLHPDVVPDEQRLEATKAFLEVQETYSILSDPERRRAYDLSLSMQAFQSVGFSNRGPVTLTPSWGFVSSPLSTSDSCSPSDFSFKGRRWETDQCW